MFFFKHLFHRIIGLQHIQDLRIVLKEKRAHKQCNEKQGKIMPALEGGISTGCSSICYHPFQYLLSLIAVSPIGVWEILRRPVADTAATGSKLSLG